MCQRLEVEKPPTPGNLALPPLSSRPTPAVISTFPLLSSRPSPAVIAAFPRCHLDRRERSQTGLGIGSSKAKTRFLASLRNDSGGIIQSFALTGTMRFLTPLRNDRRGDCHLDLPPLSSRPQGEILNRAWNRLRQSKNQISRSASK